MTTWRSNPIFKGGIEELRKNAFKKMINTEWPWTNMISLLKKFEKRKKIKILEIGCGAGCNIPFFLKEKNSYAYYAIDDNKYWIKSLKKKYPKIKKNLFCGNFLNYSFNQKFDVILDRCSMTHNSEENIVSGLGNLRKFLNKKGLYVGLNWWSSKHCDCKKANYYESKIFQEGHFAGVSGVYFSNKKQMLKFFKSWRILHLSENITKLEHLKKNEMTASWDVVAEKRKI